MIRGDVQRRSVRLNELSFGGLLVKGTREDNFWDSCRDGLWGSLMLNNSGCGVRQERINGGE